MRIEWDAAIEMDDGVVLRADIFRPDVDGRYPVVMTQGPYAKWLSFQEAMVPMWRNLETEHPDALAGSSNLYQNWETVDPEKWVPDGYVVVRVDGRGAGRSPGYLDIFSPREIRDYYECIEWAGTQLWSNGKVGLLGISYYGVSQWAVAALNPPHLAAIIPWEGATDYYREFTHHGGILSTFVQRWYPIQISSVQHGLGERGSRHPATGGLVSGPETLSDQELSQLYADSVTDLHEHTTFDSFYRDRTPDLSKITVPLLSATNWAHHLHTRGGFEGFNSVSSEHKWLEVHGLQHWVEFYTDYGVSLQKRFFGHFLKGEDTGWDDQPPVDLQVRHVDGTFERRSEQEWPLARTLWSRFYLDIESGELSGEPERPETDVSFEALGEGVTFWTPTLTEAIELTGPAAAHLTVSSTTTDADIFLTLRVQDPQGEDVTFVSAMDPKGMPGFGWLRASHRETDPGRSLPYRPWHTFENPQPLVPNQPVDLDVEIWPTSVVIPVGYRLGVTVQGEDFELDGDGPWPFTYGVEMRGNGIFVHDDPVDRPKDIFGGTTTLYSGGDSPSYLLLPVVPSSAGSDG